MKLRILYCPVKILRNKKDGETNKPNHPPYLSLNDSFTGPNNPEGIKGDAESKILGLFDTKPETGFLTLFSSFFDIFCQGSSLCLAKTALKSENLPANGQN
ncbi:hypothetical protein [Pricia antarctica]|uniref:hypothetical protein n=1 Tax=Pricia antarctica TaxID=641691 RepID=UPI000B852EC3|nr:hypothetical protein [Pricia antarctica]